MAPSAQNAGTLAAVGATARLTPPGLAGFGIQITGTWAGTVQFEGSIDGVTFRPLSATAINGTVAVTSATGNGVWQAAAPLVAMQVRMSAWTSGAALVTLNAVEAATVGAAAGGGGGGGAVTIADGADVALGSTTDAAVVGDNDGTVNAHLRGIDKILADVWDSVSHFLKVSIQNATLAVTQSGTWLNQVVGNVGSGASDSGNPVKVGGVFNSTPPTITTGQRADLQTDASGNLKVNIASGSSGNGAASNTGAAVPTQADYQGLNVGGTLRGATGANPSGTVYAAQTDLTSVNGATVATGHGTASGAVRVELPTDGTGVVVATQATASALNATVNLAQVGGTSSVTAGVNGTLAVGGNVATNVAIGTNPINNGAQAVSTENSAVTTGRMVQLVADLVGKLIVLPYSNPENFVSGAITTAMTGTTSTSLIAAPAAGLRNYLTQITVSNAHASVGTDVVIQDGSGGTTLYTLPAAAGYGGAAVSFPVPLRQPTTATALFAANVTTGASVKVSASGYKGA